MEYKISEKGNFRFITAKLREDLKNNITPDMKLLAPISVGSTIQRIDLSFSTTTNNNAIVKFKLNKEVNNISAIEAFIAVAEFLLENFKGAAK